MKTYTFEVGGGGELAGGTYTAEVDDTGTHVVVGRADLRLWDVLHPTSVAVREAAEQSTGLSLVALRSEDDDHAVYGVIDPVTRCLRRVPHPPIPTRYVDVVLSLDDLYLGAVTVGVPLQDGHGIEEVAPGVLADGRQLERSVSEMLERQAGRIRAEAKFWLTVDDPKDPAAVLAGLRARGMNRVDEGPFTMGQREPAGAGAVARELYVAALTRVGARLRVELLRRLDPAQRKEVRADDLRDHSERIAHERKKLTNKIRRATKRLAVLDAERRAIEEAP